MLKIMGKAQVSGRNYGQKIISILNGILSIKASNKTSKTEKESTTMNITQVLSVTTTAMQVINRHIS